MSDRITLEETFLPGLHIIKRIPVGDERGSLQRLYCKSILEKYAVKQSIAQINLTVTHRVGAVRGMHFQYPPYAETKIVTCLHGRVFDVAVDLRANSPTFLQWHGIILSPEEMNSFVIPEGFAHGFQALSPDSQLLYMHTAAYQRAAEGGVSPIDPCINITWPLDITEMSERDKHHPLLSADFKGIKHELQTL